MRAASQKSASQVAFSMSLICSVIFLGSGIALSQTANAPTADSIVEALKSKGATRGAPSKAAASLINALKDKTSRGISIVAALLLVAALSSCGFQLRGQYALPFSSVFVSTSGASVVASALKRELANIPTKLMPSAKDADAQLNILEDRRERQILSLSGAGRVREYELKLRVSYQLMDATGRVFIPTSEIQLSRILSYDDSRIIAKQQEEALLYQDMERDAVGQILRRMTAIKRPV